MTSNSVSGWSNLICISGHWIIAFIMFWETIKMLTPFSLQEWVQQSWNCCQINQSSILQIGFVFLKWLDSDTLLQVAIILFLAGWKLYILLVEIVLFVYCFHSKHSIVLSCGYYEHVFVCCCKLSFKLSSACKKSIVRNWCTIISSILWQGILFMKGIGTWHDMLLGVTHDRAKQKKIKVTHVGTLYNGG